MIKKITKLIKSACKKVLSLIMSVLMIATGLSMSGIQSAIQNAFAISASDFYNEATLTITSTGGPYNLKFGGETVSTTMYYMSLGNNISLCLNHSKSARTGYVYAKTSTVTNSMIKKAVVYANSHTDNQSRAVCQLVAWYYSHGASLTESELVYNANLIMGYTTTSMLDGPYEERFNFYTGQAESLAFRDEMIEKYGSDNVTWGQDSSTYKYVVTYYKLVNYDTYTNILTAIENTSTSGYTVNYWYKDDDSQPMASLENGDTPDYGEVYDTATAKANLSFELTKKDGDTGHTMEGVTYNIKLGSLYSGTKTTDSNGKITYSASNVVSKSAVSDTYYYTNAKSQPNLDLLTNANSDHWFETEADAKAAAKADAEDKARDAVDDEINGTYSATETNSIENYYISSSGNYSTTVSWTVSSWGSSLTRTLSVGDTVYNYPQHGTLTVTKEDTESGNTVKKNSNAESHTEATYAIYAAEDIYHTDGGSCTSKYYSEDQKVGTFTTSNGVGSYTGTDYTNYLYVGSYYYVETTAPNSTYETENVTYTDDYKSGYIVDTTKHSFTISYNGDKWKSESSSAKSSTSTQTDSPQRVTITMTKKDSDLYNKTYEYNSSAADYNGDGASGDATLAGATYGLYAAEDIYYPDGSGIVTYNNTSGSRNEITLLEGTSLKIAGSSSTTSVKATAGTLLATAVTDENGQIEWGHLYNGEYYVQEIKVPTTTVNIWGDSTSGGVTTRIGTAATKDCYLLDTTKYYYDGTYTGQTTAVIAAKPKTNSNGYVFDTPVTGYVEIRKASINVDSGETTYEDGAVFRIILKSDIVAYLAKYPNATETEAKEWLVENKYYDELTTATVNGVAGYAISCELPIGDYIIVQTKTVGEYGLSDDIEFSINTQDDGSKAYACQNDEGHSDYLLIIDSLYNAYLKIVKKDSVTKEVVTLNNATFKVVTDQAITWGGKSYSAGDALTYEYSDGTTITEWTTDTDTGTVQLPEKLPSGTYTITEITAPELHVKNTGSVTARITVSNASDSAEDVVTVYFEDTPVVGKVTVTKKGEVLTGVTQDTNTGNYSFTYETDTLAGAVIKLVAASNIIDPATGDVLIEAETTIETKTSDEDGKITFTGSTNSIMKKYGGLLLGEYYIEEVTAPYGYELNTETENVTLVYKDQSTATVTSSKTITNDRTKVILSVYKYENLDGSTAPLSGGTFTLTATEDIKDLSGNVIIKAGTVISTKSANNGEVDFDVDLPIGYTFQIDETEAPTGYVTNNYSTTFETVYNSQYVDTSIYETIYNEPKVLEFAKVDSETGVSLDGAYFEIRDSQGNILDSWETYAGYNHTIKAGYDDSYTLKVGETYYLYETKAPKGYNLADPVAFTVDQTSIQTVTMEDDYTTTEISVAKQGEALTGIETDSDGNITFTYETKLIGGAVFEITAKDEIVAPDGSGEVVYEKGDVVATVTSVDDDYVTVSDLPLGNYMVEEITPPEGYQLAKNVY